MPFTVCQYRSSGCRVIRAEKAQEENRTAYALVNPSSQSLSEFGRSPRDRDADRKSENRAQVAMYDAEQAAADDEHGDRGKHDAHCVKKFIHLIPLVLGYSVCVGLPPVTHSGKKNVVISLPGISSRLQAFATSVNFHAVLPKSLFEIAGSLIPIALANSVTLP